MRSGATRIVICVVGGICLWCLLTTRAEDGVDPPESAWDRYLERLHTVIYHSSHENYLVGSYQYTLRPNYTLWFVNLFIPRI